MENIIPLYSGKIEDFNWVGFGSGSGTNLRECAKIIRPLLILSDRMNPSLFNLEELANAEHVRIPAFKMKGGVSFKDIQDDKEKLRDYTKLANDVDKKIVELLYRHQDAVKKEINLIILGGYMSLTRTPLLDAFPDKIINVHPSYLPANLRSDGGLDSNISRLYIGDDAVYDALRFGEKETKSSVIIVDGGVDHGEILTQGPSVSIDESKKSFYNENKRDTVSLKELADYHQCIQKEKSDWPALTKALELISQGRLGIGTRRSTHNEWRAVYLDGKKLPYSGLELQR